MRTKKKLFAAALAICLLSTISFSTLAWFNATESVTNKFMVASTGTGTGGGSTAEKIFSVDLWEYVGDKDNVADEDKDAEGNPVVDAGEKDHDGLAFENILPGVVYHKEPVVENTGSYDQWIRVVVTVTKATAWKDILSTYGITDLGTIFLGHDDTDADGDSAVWKRDMDPSATWIEGNAINYVYYLNEKLAPREMAVLFTGVKLPEQMTQADAATLLDGTDVEFDITIRADAIQTEGLNATNAKEAFVAASWPAKPVTP